MWNSAKVAQNNDEATKPRSGRKLFGNRGKDQKEAVTQPEPDWAAQMPKSLSAREEGETRGEDDGDDQRKKRRWLLLQRALSAEEENDDTAVREADKQEQQQHDDLKCTSTNSFSSFRQSPRQTKAVFRQFGVDAQEVVKVEQTDDVPLPESPDHVLIRVQASTVTLNDCILRRGLDFDVVNPSSLPMTPGHDVVGRIIAVGANVKDFNEGDRVAALIRTGGNARYASVPEKSLVRVPHTLDSAEAACMVTVYSAAYQSLKMISSNGPMFSLLGKKVLVIGGMDSIGQAIVQMCNKARAEVYATAPSRRHGYIRTMLGAVPLSESCEEWMPVVEGRMDVVFDGTGEDLKAASRAARNGGEVICFGNSSLLKQEMGVFGAPISAHFNRWRTQMAQVKSIDIYDFFLKDPETYKKHLYSLFQLLKWNKLRPHLAKRVALSDVAYAHTKLETGEVRGCVVCLPWKVVGQRHITKESEQE